jgi:hypothetical protein
VDRAKFKSVFACCVKYCLPIPMTHTINYLAPPRRRQHSVPGENVDNATRLAARRV